MVFLVSAWRERLPLRSCSPAAYPAAQWWRPVLGRCVRSHGRSEVLLLSEAGTLAGWGLFHRRGPSAWSPSSTDRRARPAWAAFSRSPMPFLSSSSSRAAVHGLYSGKHLGSPTAYVADVTSDADRTELRRMAVSSRPGFRRRPALAGRDRRGTRWRMTAAGDDRGGHLALRDSMIAFGLPESRPISTEEKKESRALAAARWTPLRRLSCSCSVPHYTGFNFFVHLSLARVRAPHWDVREHRANYSPS